MITSRRPSVSMSGRHTSEAPMMPAISGDRPIAVAAGVSPSAVWQKRETT
jgi:hypothetical protein